ncbi:MAG: type III pantothenate kinase [bacterium]
MLLAVDIGNTNIVLGLFNKNRLTGKQRILTGHYARIKATGRVDAAIVSSVVPRLTGIICRDIEKRQKVRPVVVSWKTIKGLKIALKKKQQVGVDRLINAVAVKCLYASPAVIIDFGTATTFCALDRNGRYLGGAITSGLAISRDVLHERAAKLPLIKIKKPKSAIGQDTVEAMRSGLFYGYIDMVEGMIKRFKAKLGQKAKVIATGGLSKTIASGTKMIDIVDMDLTLKGLNIIYRGARRAKGARRGAR